MKKQVSQPGLFGENSPVIKHGAKGLPQKKKIDLSAINERDKLDMSQRGLLGCEDFGDYIKNWRGNKV